MNPGTQGWRPERAAGDGGGCAPRSAAPVIALHCSGADGGQWRKLAAALGPRYEMFAPGFIGCPEIGHWSGERAFSLADEAQVIIGLVDALGEPIHLVGHSSEPSAFHILRQLGARGDGAIDEIEAVAEAIAEGLVSGAYQAAARRFVDYWNGAGTWASLRPEVREGLIRWLPKAALDFRALIGERTPIASYARIAGPVHILRGQHARAPSRLIADVLARAIPSATLDVFPDAGHMGPLTHATEVNACIAGYIRAATYRRPVREHGPVAA
jgi:pimeloyl-ACP methyl ester carboxylesterase